MTDLCKLAQHYGTDKYPSYTSFYHMLLSPRRESITSVLEIGIGSVSAMAHVENYQPGASLRMWSDYFPNASILGVDIDPSTMTSGARIRTQLLDQANVSQLKELATSTSFDLIIDDGSHDENHQLLTLKYLYPALNNGGIYIIEDVNNAEFIISEFEHDLTLVHVRPTVYKYIGKLLLLQKEETNAN